MNNIEILFYGIIVIILLYILSLTLLNFRKIKESKRMVSLREYEINMNCNVKIDVIEEIDQIIMNCFNEYIILNIEFRELEYINKEVENIIAKDVSRIVIDRMSPIFLNKISLVYNKNNFDEMISKKVYLYTMNYVLTKNEAQ